MGGGILADLWVAVAAILLTTGWGNRVIPGPSAIRLAAAAGLAAVWTADRWVLEWGSWRVNAGGALLALMALVLLVAASTNFRTWLFQTNATVLTTSVSAVCWAALPYTPLAAWPQRDILLAVFGGVVAGLFAPTPLLAATAGFWGVVCGNYQVLFVQYRVDPSHMVWLDPDLLDFATTASAAALIVKTVFGALSEAGLRRLFPAS